MTNLILFAMFLGVVLGIISGRIYMHFVPEMSGQLLPTWLFTGIMSAVITFLVSVMLSIAFKNNIETHFIKLAIITAVVNELLLVVIMYKSVQNK